MAETNSSPAAAPSPAALDLMCDIWHLLGIAEQDLDACEAAGVLAQVLGMIVSSIKGRDERRAMAEHCEYIVAHCMQLGIQTGDHTERVN